LADFLFGYVGPTLIRKSFLEAVGGFDDRLSLGEDLDLMLRLAMAGGRFVAVASAEPLFFYREAPDSLWRRSVTRVEPMRNLVQVFRRAEAFLVKKEAGRLHRGASDALATRYLRTLSFFFEHDREAFHETLGYIRGLGLAYPPGTSAALRLMSRLIGYRNAKVLAESLRLYGRPRRQPPAARAT
jgi:GT2 family glycosyltransferase